MPRLLLPLALMFVLASCAHVPGGKVQTLSLDEGQTAHLNNGGSITFTNVVNESRCPTGAQCIWAGTVTANFLLVPNGSSTNPVHLLAVLPGGVGRDDTANQLPVDTLGVSVTLAELTPYPVAGQDTGSKKHRALVKVRASEAP